MGIDDKPAAYVFTILAIAVLNLFPSETNYWSRTLTETAPVKALAAGIELPWKPAPSTAYSTGFSCVQTIAERTTLTYLLITIHQVVQLCKYVYSGESIPMKQRIITLFSFGALAVMVRMIALEHNAGRYSFQELVLGKVPSN